MKKRRAKNKTKQHNTNTAEKRTTRDNETKRVGDELNEIVHFGSPLIQLYNRHTRIAYANILKFLVFSDDFPFSRCVSFFSLETLLNDDDDDDNGQKQRYKFGFMYFCLCCSLRLCVLLLLILYANSFTSANIRTYRWNRLLISLQISLWNQINTNKWKYK